MVKMFGNTRAKYIAVIALIVMFLSVGAAFAQRYLGSIAGEVADATGAKIPNASVIAEDVATHYKMTVTSNGSGTYSFAALNPGTYTVSTAAQGFGGQTRTNIVLTAGQLQKVDFQMQPGSAAETITVGSDNVLLDTGSANIATTLTTQEVTDLPNNGRNPFVLATLAVGVTNGGSGGYFQGKSSQFTNPFSGVAVQIGSSGQTGHNRLTLDGIPDDPPERLSGATYAGFVPSPEAVQEVKVQTSIFDAQVGHGNGTVTNTVVRSGANAVHGAAYYVFQNTYLNANTYERVPNQNAAVSPTRRTNDQLSQTGLVFDGPVYIPKLYNGRDKTFFLVAFERYQSHTSLTYNSLVPTQAERGGDFSALCSVFSAQGLCTSGIQLYDPLSPLDANGNRTSYFANNQIPAPRINATGAALLNYYPLPNANVSPTINYVSNQTSYLSTYPSFIARVDQAIAAKDKFNAIYFQAGLTQNYPHQGFPGLVAPSGYGYHVYRNTRGGSLDEVHQFSSNMVLDSRFGLVYHPFGLVYPGSQGFDLSSLHITNSNYPYASFPGTALSDSYSGLAAGAGGQISESTTGSLEEILSKTFGRHSVRFGFDGNLLRYNVQNPQSGFGNFNFSRTFTQQNYASGSANSGDPLAALLLGDFTSATYNIQVAYALQQLYMAGFAQDDWRLSDKLTVNLGVRYDYESPLTDRYNRQNSNFCTTCSNPLQVPGLTLNGGLQFVSASNRFPYSRDLNNVQPRIGLAYQVHPNTILRAGGGIIYYNTIESPIGTGFSQTTGGSANTTMNLPLATIDNPFPNGVLLPTGSTLGLSTAVGTNVSFVDPNHVSPKLQQYTLNLQQKFPGDLVVQISYVGERSLHTEVSHNINVLPQQYYSTTTDYGTNLANQNFLNANVANPLVGMLPPSANSNLRGTTIARNLLLLPYPEFGAVTENYSPIGGSTYNALQIQASKPMKHHFSLQGSFTWAKLMDHNTFLNNYGAGSALATFQDPGATLIGNLFGTLQLPKLLDRPAWQRLALGGWQLNAIMRAQNGNLIGAPGGVYQIGSPTQGNSNFSRYFNTCYQNTTGALVNTSYSSSGAISGQACDATSPTPAYRQRLSYTVQTNNPYMNIRQRIYPLEDASLFKQFILREGLSFEIRGEFFNIGNRTNFGGPGTGLGNSTYGLVTFTQANDPRIGQLTGRINF